MSPVDAWEEIFRRRAWGRWPNEDVVRTIARTGRTDLHVLEVGCGAGAQLWYLAQEGHRAVGLDLAPSGLDQARDRLREGAAATPLVRGDATVLPFRDATFDVVLDVETLAHVGSAPAQRAGWREAARVLAPGGALLSIGFTAATTGTDGGDRVDERTRSGLGDGPLAGIGPVTVTDAAAASAHCAAVGLELVEHQQRRRTVGPDHDVVDELVVLARRP